MAGREVDGTPPRIRGIGDEPLHPPPKRRGAGCVVGILVLLLLLAAGGFFGWRYWKSQRAALRHARTELREAQQRVRDGHAKTKEAADALAKQRADFDAERARMQAELAGARGRAEEASAVLDRLRGVVGTDEGEIESEGGRVTLKLVDRVLFRSGESELTPGGIRVLARVGEALKALEDKQIWVQGHTDDQPIRDTKLFATNWELSAARALSVVHYLQEQAGIDARRLAAVGFSQYRPVGRNRAKNRRIEIVLFPSEVRVVPGRVPPPTATAAPATAAPASTAPTKSR